MFTFVRIPPISLYFGLFYFHIHVYGCYHITILFLTLDEVKLCQEFELFGNIQLEVSEGRISSQSEMLEILNCFAQPDSVQKQKKK